MQLDTLVNLSKFFPFTNDIVSSLLISNAMTVFGYKKKLIKYRVDVLLILRLSNLI
jgi:hypothetical protein